MASIRPFTLRWRPSSDNVTVTAMREIVNPIASLSITRFVEPNFEPPGGQEALLYLFLAGRSFELNIFYVRHLA